MRPKLFSYLLTLTLAGLAAWAAGSLYYRSLLLRVIPQQPYPIEFVYEQRKRLLVIRAPLRSRLVFS